MDKNHQLDAPNNDSLAGIDQIGDRSGLSAVYHHAHNEWDGVELMSGEARAKKQAEEEIRINMGIRKWFPVIGFLIPFPVSLFLLLGAAGTYLKLEEMSTVIIIPVFFGTALGAYISYRALKAVFKIFYDHSIKTIPYLIAHIIFLGVAFQGLFKWAQTFHTGWAVGDVLIVGAFLEALSIVLCGVLLFLWTSRKIPANLKIGILIGLIVIIAGIQLAYEFL